MSEPRGGGCTLIFSYIGLRRLGHFLGFKILNFNIFGCFQKNEYFWGNEDFVDYFMGKIGLYLGVISMHFRVFSKGQGTELGIFLGLL